VAGVNLPHFPRSCKNDVDRTIFRDFWGVNEFGIISAIEKENRFYNSKNFHYE